jgi:hypothetical protein
MYEGTLPLLDLEQWSLSNLPQISTWPAPHAGIVSRIVQGQCSLHHHPPVYALGLGGSEYAAEGELQGLSPARPACIGVNAWVLGTCM